MPKSAVCKFVASRVHDNGGNIEVQLSAQYDEKSVSDKSFSKYTPSGSMQAFISNDALKGFFVEGQPYRITIEPWKE